jgi:RsiW-degrading membrane proteinase PrsW (M82 family)
LVSYPATPPQQRAFIPPLPRRIRKVGAPLGVIIALGTVVGLIVILVTAVNPVGTTIAFTLATLALAIVLLAYLWLDRWEPEPPRLLLFSFLWGASVAVVLSVALEVALEPLFGTDGTIALGAPLIEEAAKGLFLLLMMTGRRRNELNTLTDCLVYAGITAAGFAWLENIFYISDSGTLAESLGTAALRLVMGPFAHPLFTTMTGIGVYFALQQRSAVAKAGYILLGYAGAVLMHALWNGSSLMSIEAYFLVYLLWMVPVFGLAIVLAVHSRRREQRIVAEKLPGMVAASLVTANEATWLGSLRNRSQAKAVKNFAAQVVELGYVRDRIDRGFGDQRVFALQNEEAYWVHMARAAAPTLQSLAGYRAPGS